MNGELQQACYLAAAVKKAMLKKEKLSYQAAPYEKSLPFVCVPAEEPSPQKTQGVLDMAAWYDRCLQKGCAT